MKKTRFYGIGEPLIEREKDTGVSAADYLELVSGMGCNAFRNWMHITDLLIDPVTPNESVIQKPRDLSIFAASAQSNLSLVPSVCDGNFPIVDFSDQVCHIINLVLQPETW